MTEFDTRLETIPRQDWQETCERFGNRHRGWMVQIIKTPSHVQASTEAGGRSSMAPYQPHPAELVSNVALHGLVFKESGGAPKLILVIGDSGGSETSLTIRPQTILLERQGDADAGIRVEERSGDRIRILFRVPAAPETLDGLAEGEL